MTTRRDADESLGREAVVSYMRLYLTEDLTHTDTCGRIAHRLDVPPETVRRWIREMSEEISEVLYGRFPQRQENRQLRRELERAHLNEQIHRSLAAFGGEGLVRRYHVAELVEFIRTHRDEFGVETLCRTLTELGAPISASTFYAYQSRGFGPSARELTDAVDANTLWDLWDAHGRRFGRRRLWQAGQDAGLDWGRDRVERLMRIAGISGAAPRDSSE